METNTNLVKVALDPVTAQAVLAAMMLTGVEEPPPPIPSGDLGGCVACGHTVVSHFGADGRWVGCLKGEADTVFILVPAKRGAATTSSPRTESRGKAGGAKRTNGHGTANETPQTVTSTPGMAQPRFRYISTLHHRAKVEKLNLSPVRTKVLETIHDASPAGVLSRDIITRAKLPHGSVQQTLHWLRAHKLVKARKVTTT